MAVYEIGYYLDNKQTEHCLDIEAGEFCEAVKKGLKEVLKRRKGNEYYNLFSIKKTERKALLRAV